MSFWNGIFGQLSRRELPNDNLRNSIFGIGTAAMPMPLPSEERRMQRRLYDMPNRVPPLGGFGIGQAPDWMTTDATEGSESDPLEGMVFDPNRIDPNTDLLIPAPGSLIERPVRTRTIMPPRPEPGAFFFGDVMDALTRMFGGRGP